MSDSPFFSIIVTTCRGDYPYVNDKSKHVLDAILENCDRQKFRDFELILVDLCYDYRSDWQKNRKQVDFPVLHIPDKDSIFRDLRLIRISTARNTGLIYARGKAVVFSDDGQYWSEDAFGYLKPWADNNAGSTCRLHRDDGHGPVEIDSRWMAYGMEGTLKTKVVNASDIGYMGGTLSMAPLKYMLQCNGWDEMFDGARQLEDSDMARRLGATGLKMAFEGHPLCVEHELGKCNTAFVRNDILAKCNGSYCYPLWKKEPRRIKANTVTIPDDVLDTFMSKNCLKRSSDGFCEDSGDVCNMSSNRRSLMNIYKDERLVFDIEVMRKARSWETVMQDELLF